LRFAAFVAILAMTILSPAMAANLIATPKIALEERWDSNIQNTATDEISDFVTRATPSLTFTIETYLTKLNLTGGVDFERYAKHSELNERAAMFYDLNTTRPLQFTPRFSVLPSVRFAETNDPVRRNVLTQTAIEGLPPSETIVTARTKSREFTGSLQLTYHLTPIVDLGLGGGGTKRTFLDNNAGGVDSDTVFGNASISYRFTPRFSSGIYVSTGRNTFKNDTDSRTHNLALSLNYLLSEHFTLDARAGANYLKETTATGEDTSTSPSGQLSLTYRWKDFKADLLGSYGLAGGGSFGVTTHRGNIQLKLSNQFVEGWWWDLSGSYQTNRSLDTPRTEDVSTWYGNAGLRYKPARWASFRLSGDTVRQRSRNGVEGSDLDRNSVTLGIDLSNDYNLF
jgi:hypothetical protein